MSKHTSEAGRPRIGQWLTLDDLDLTRMIRANDTVVIAQGPGLPLPLCELLVQQQAEIGPLHVFVGGLFPNVFDPARVGQMRFSAYGVIGAGAMALSKAGNLNIIPVIYAHMPRMFSERSVATDVAFLQMSEAPDGRLTLGMTHDYILEAARCARVVIAEVNAQAPWVHGAECPSDLRIDYAVRVDHEPVGLGSAPQGEVEHAIAKHVAQRVPDGATIQIGIGAIPDAIITALSNHKDLGVHSGLISDRLIELIKKGVLTNALKPIDTGVSITNVVLGTGETKAYAHMNPQLRMPHSLYCHAPQVLAQLDRFYAINSAIEVDLTGQVNSEVADGVYVGAAGGQPDFIRGALLTERGRSMIVLPSTARKGTRSRIVAQLSNGTVTTPRCDADLVITEWGVADLRGQNLGERVKRMVAIADPSFRDQLSASARAVWG